MKSKLVLILVVLLAFGIVLIGCDTGTNGGNNNGGGPAVAKEDLVGEWRMSGGYPRLTLNADDSWSYEYSEILGSNMTTTWSVSGSKLTLRYSDGDERGTVALSGDKRTLTVSNKTGHTLSNGAYTKQ
jgi:hypothetical protein